MHLFEGNNAATPRCNKHQTLCDREVAHFIVNIRIQGRI